MKVFGKFKIIMFSFVILGVSACQIISPYKFNVQEKSLKKIFVLKINTTLNYFGDYKFYKSIKEKADKKEFKMLVHFFDKDIASDSVFVFSAKTYIPPFFTHYLLKLKDEHHLPSNKILNFSGFVNDFFYVFKANGSHFLLVQIAKNKNAESKDVAQREFREIVETITTN